MSSSSDGSGAVRGYVLGVCAVGVLSTAAIVILTRTAWAGIAPEVSGGPLVFTAAVGITILGQLLYVRVRHGDTWEELNFFEVVLAVGILLLSPTIVLAATLTGVLVGELVIRRAWIKVAYNVGSYAVASAAMIATYQFLYGIQREWFGVNPEPTSLVSMLSLIAASGVFTAINLALVAQLIHRTTGTSPWDVWREEGRLSALMALGSVGMGFMAVALGFKAPAALPFAFLPALAIWYAYLASAEHAEARERNRWLVTLGGALAQHTQARATLVEATEAIRQIVGAPEHRVLQPLSADEADDAPTEQILASVWTEPGPRHLTSDELPAGWRTGWVTRLDLGTANPGALLLGSTEPYRRSRIAGRSRGWDLDEADGPVLGALVAAVGSAMRAGAAFDALTEETAKLSAVVDNTSDGIAVVDDAGAIRLWSQTMALMTGIHAADLVGDPADAPEIVRTLVSAAIAVDTTAGAAPIQVHLVRADGEELDVSVSAVRVREAAGPAGSTNTGWVRILTVHDETRERRVERMKTDFVATISHELRTPITPIKGYAHLLSTRGDRVTPEKRDQALKVISDRADHLSRLVDDLLLASQVSNTARLAIEMEVADLGEVVQQAAAGFPQMAKRIRVTLPEGPVLVECDRIRAVQCLTNLISNAEKYAPGDSMVEIWVETAGPQASAHVRDHGAGVPEAERERVFERFYRREDPFTMRTGGAGLGLHIARELAVAMGGALTLRAPLEGTGAEFILHLVTTQAHGSSAEPVPHKRNAGQLPPAQATGSADDTGTTSDEITRELAESGSIEAPGDRRAAM